MLSLFDDKPQQEDNSFKLDWNGIALTVTAHDVSDTKIFRVDFADKRKPLNVTKALPGTPKAFWTSVPQGRHEEAEAIGLLIVEYLKNR